ncbi:MAG TPA: hypothetical protein DDW30_00665 [Clostridiales bacterium]|nr:hypothetical protein [Clostridiales bacterium]
MLYRQDAPFLRYEQIPISSTCYNYSPRHATQPTELKKHGILWFSVPHNHLAVEILRIVQGEVWVSVDGTPHALYAGDLVFLNPFDVHATYVTAPETMNEFHVINFDLSLLKNGAVPDFDAYLESIEENARRMQHLILHDDPHAAELNERLRAIHACYAERSTPAGFMRILAGLLDLMAALERDGFVSPERDGKMSRQAAFTKEIVQYVSRHYAEPLTTAAVADRFHYSKSYFCRSFKAVFNQSFVDYLHSYRISIARSLSLDRYRTIGSIAQAVGFASYNHFATCFLKYTGETPKRFYEKNARG